MAVHSWLTSSLVRHFVHDPAKVAQPLVLETALNEQFSFQVALRMAEGSPQGVRVWAEGPADWVVRVRRVGQVPVLHHNTPIPATQEDVDGLGRIPGYVPDPLFNEDALTLGPAETHSFWITVRPGAAAVPGPHAIHVIVSCEDGEEIKHTAQACLHDVSIERRQGFAVTHWFYVDALIDWYRTDLFDERFWSILPEYLCDVVEHGQDTIYVPVFTPPLDGVKRPSQLLQVECTGPDRYSFGWRDVKRYVDLARQCGIEQFEWCHLFTQWGARNAIRVYDGQGRDENLLWPPETGATSSTYRSFLAQFLPELHRFLSDEGLLNRSFFHVSDEPHGEQQLLDYGQARGLLRELAPWMKVMDALTEIEFARHALTDMPVPSVRTTLEFVQEGIPCWCYYCCGPRDRYINRLLDTPLAKIAMHGMLFYRWPLRGFLHWGYNYWYQSQTRTLVDPYTVQDGLAWHRGWAYGDPFEVYPGPDGPIDSIRWEVFGESLQDFALLQTLGVPKDDPALESIRSFADFPKTEAWRLQTRARLLKQNEGGRNDLGRPHTHSWRG